MYFSLYMICCYIKGASTSFKVTSPKMEVTNKPWKGPPTWVQLRPLPPKKTIDHIPWKLVVGRWTFQEAASKAAAGETAQLLSERTELQQRLRKTRDLGKGGPEGTMGKGDLSWSVGWGFGCGWFVVWLGIYGFMSGKVRNVFRESAFGFVGFLWIWGLRGIDFGLDLGWFSQSRLFFVHFFVFCMDISLTHVFFGYCTSAI